jgi:hypothetical protein
MNQMKKLALVLSLVPSIALAHPGHDDVGVGGDRAAHAVITNPVLVVVIFALITLAFYRVTRMVRK